MIEVSRHKHKETLIASEISNTHKSKEKYVYLIYIEMMQCASQREKLWDKNTLVHLNFHIAIF